MALAEHKKKRPSIKPLTNFTQTTDLFFLPNRAQKTA